MLTGLRGPRESEPASLSGLFLLILLHLLKDILVLFGLLDLLIKLSDEVLLHKEQLLRNLLFLFAHAVDSLEQVLNPLMLPLYPRYLFLRRLPRVLPQDVLAQGTSLVHHPFRGNT